jgi:hypothetical protein
MIIECWIDGIPAPFRLRYRYADAAAKTFGSILRSSTPGRPSEMPWADDDGQIVSFPQGRLIGIRQYSEAADDLTNRLSIDGRRL